MHSYAEAKAFAVAEQKHASRNWSNSCQMFARTAFGAAAWAPSAREAFNSTPAAHRHTSFPPPAGSIAYYGVADRGFGHAVVVVENGWVYSTDILRSGCVDKVKWNVFEKAWGLSYRGWIDTTPSGPLPIQHPAPAPKPVPVPAYPGKAAFTLGASGPAIAAVQHHLGRPVGKWNTLDKVAVIQYQKNHRPWLGVADGIIGPKTYKWITSGKK
jgi:hypothetical protein